MKERITNIARMNIYQFLSLAFLYPDKELGHFIKDGAVEKELISFFDCLCKKPDRGLNEIISSLLRIARRMTLDELQEEYCRIFTHTMSREHPNCETEYGKSHIFEQSQKLADIAGFYRAFGLQTDGLSSKRVDNVSMEFEFMYFLIFKEEYANQNGKSEEKNLCREAQKKFFTEHIGNWIPDFVKDLRKNPSNGFYLEISKLTDFFISYEGEFTNDEMQKRGVGDLSANGKEENSVSGDPGK